MIKIALAWIGGILLCVAFWGAIIVGVSKCAQADPMTDVYGATVECCCRTYGGGRCCAVVALCSGFVPGCLCR
jgi:hypothetical protein